MAMTSTNVWVIRLLKRLSDAVGGALTVLMVAVGFVVVPAAPSAAISCGSTVNAAMYQSDATHRGEFVSAMSVFDHNNPDNAPNGATNVSCDRVSTLDVFNSSTKQMEIGWHIVPDNSSVCPINTSNPQQPFFVIIRTSPSGQFCRYSGTPLQLSTSTHSFKETNPNQNGVWSFYLDGTSIGDSTTTDWSVGWTTSNGERHTDGDSAHSKFVGLQYITGSGPTSWDSPRLFCDSDTYYDTNTINGANDQVLVHNTNSGFTNC